MALPDGVCIGIYDETVDPDAGGYDRWPRSVWISFARRDAIVNLLRNFAENDHVPPQSINGVKTAIKQQLLGAANAAFVQSESDDWFRVVATQFADVTVLEWAMRRVWNA